MSIQPNRSTREDDEWLLGLVRLRCHHGSGQIGRHIDIPPSRVRTLCNRVLADDLKQSGESEAIVRSAYWRD